MQKCAQTPDWYTHAYNAPFVFTLLPPPWLKGPDSPPLLLQEASLASQAGQTFTYTPPALSTDGIPGAGPRAAGHVGNSNCPGCQTDHSIGKTDL